MRAAVAEADAGAEVTPAWAPSGQAPWRQQMHRLAPATKCLETYPFQSPRSSEARIARKTSSIILQPRNPDLGPQVLLPAQEFEHTAVSHVQC